MGRRLARSVVSQRAGNAQLQKHAADCTVTRIQHPFAYKSHSGTRHQSETVKPSPLPRKTPPTRGWGKEGARKLSHAETTKSIHHKQQQSLLSCPLDSDKNLCEGSQENLFNEWRPLPLQTMACLVCNTCRGLDPVVISGVMNCHNTKNSVLHERRSIRTTRPNGRRSFDILSYVGFYTFSVLGDVATWNVHKTPLSDQNLG